MRKAAWGIQEVSNDMRKKESGYTYVTYTPFRHEGEKKEKDGTQFRLLKFKVNYVVLHHFGFPVN